MDYLRWYRRVLNIPVENEQSVFAIQPEEQTLTIQLKHHQVKARKVVLATGRMGCGGYEVPHFMQGVPKRYYAHTCEEIDFEALKGKRVGILGVGASSFDAAAVALETGSHSVDLLCRRSRIPQVNKAIQIIYPGFSSGYYQLPDEARWQIFNHLYGEGAPPPFESLDRLAGYSNFQVKCKLAIASVREQGDKVVLSTSQGDLAYDYVILGTGFSVDVSKQPEISSFANQIMLWQDRPLDRTVAATVKQGRFPYLGPHFQFLEKNPGAAPFLKDIYCFNWSATFSHALLSSDIPDISVGAARLARGIAADFFAQDWKTYDRMLQDFQVHEFEDEKYPFLS